MKRRLFNILTIFSLLLCLASAGMWVRSIYVQEYAEWQMDWHMSNDIELFSARGRLLMDCVRQPLIDRPPEDVPGFTTDSLPDLMEIDENDRTNGQWWWEWGGFGMASGRRGGLFGPPMTAFEVELPYWFPVVLTAVLPLYWLKKKRKRHPPGYCTHCGYDLRATPDRCPECGAVPRAVKA